MNNRLGGASVFLMIALGAVGRVFAPSAPASKSQQPAVARSNTPGSTLQPAAQPNPNVDLSCLSSPPAVAPPGYAALNLIGREQALRAWPCQHKQSLLGNMTDEEIADTIIRKSRSGDELRFMVALVPDPLSTSLALLYDRSINALQAAAADEVFSFAGIEVPWDPRDLKLPEESDKALVANNRRLLNDTRAGAMLFVKLENDQTRTKLVVLLVPESPTIGVSFSAWDEAVDIATKFGASDLPVTGPNFSGSVRALLKRSDDTKPRPHFISGTVSVQSEISALEDWNKNGAVNEYCKDSGSSCFASFELPASATINALSHVYGYGDGPLAWHSCPLGEKITAIELSEDQTIFGLPDFSPKGDKGGLHETAGGTEIPKENAPAKPSPETNKSGHPSIPGRSEDDQTPCLRLVRMPFSRGISHVRSAYASSLTSLTLAQVKGESAPQIGVQLSLDNPNANPLDTQAQFAVQSTISQESLLAAIGSRVHDSHAQFLLIEATDPLDQIFLARYFRRASPNVRLVTVAPDMLIPNTHAEFDLDGMLSTSATVPFESVMVPVGGETGAGQRMARVFEDSFEINSYLAARRQISPGAFKGAPGVQVAVASGSRYWPLWQSGHSVEYVHSSSSKCFPFVDSSLPSWKVPPFPWQVVAFCILWFAGYHAAAVILANLRRGRFNFYNLQLFAAQPQHDENGEGMLEFACRRSYLLIALLQVAILEVTIVMPGLCFLRSGIGNSEIVTFLNMIALVLIVVLAAWLTIVGMVTSPRLHFEGGNYQALLTLSAWVWFILVVVIWASKLTLPPRDDLREFANRCVQLTSGVCPGLPIALITIGFYLYAMLNLRRLDLAHTRDPEFPRLDREPGAAPVLPEASLHQVQHLLRAQILPPVDLLCLLIAIIAGFFIVQPFRTFSSIEGPVFSALYALFFFCAALTAFSVALRFGRLWRTLRIALDILEGSPLRQAFSRLPQEFFLNAVWHSEPQQRSILLPMRWVQYLKATALFASQTLSKIDENAINKEVNEIVHWELSEQKTIRQTYKQFSKKLNEYANQYAGSLRQSSAKGTSETNKIERRQDLPTDGEVSANQNMVANEFMAARFTAFIRYVLIQLRNLLTYVTFGTVLIFAAARSSHFGSPQTITWAITVMVVLLTVYVGKILIQMQRSAILSRLSNTAIGELSYTHLTWQLLTIAGLPILTVLAGHSATVSNFLFSWVKPAVDTLH